MYRHLLKLPTTSKVLLEPFTFQQTKAFMQVRGRWPLHSFPMRRCKRPHAAPLCSMACCDVAARALQVVAENHYPDQYVLAVMEKTGGMPLYIEKVRGRRRPCVVCDDGAAAHCAPQQAR